MVDTTDGGAGSVEAAGRDPVTRASDRDPVTRASGRDPVTRASDRERDAVLQRVQQAFAEGRLDDAEFDERMRATLAAKTNGELDALLTDLPAPATAAG